MGFNSGFKGLTSCKKWCTYTRRCWEDDGVLECGTTLFVDAY